MKCIVPRFTFTAKVMKLIHEVAHHKGKKTPIVKEGGPSKSSVIFYLLIGFTSDLHR